VLYLLISTLRAAAIARQLASEAELDQIEADIQAIVAEALAFAEQSPYPDPATATTYIFSEDRRV